jgi:hypothetical protein
MKCISGFLDKGVKLRIALLMDIWGINLSHSTKRIKIANVSLVIAIRIGIEEKRTKEKRSKKKEEEEEEEKA